MKDVGFADSFHACDLSFFHLPFVICKILVCVLCGSEKKIVTSRAAGHRGLAGSFCVNRTVCPASAGRYIFSHVLRLCGERVWLRLAAPCLSVFLGGFIHAALRRESPGSQRR